MRMAETLREDPAILRDVALFHTVSFRGAGKAERTQEGREILDTMHTPGHCRNHPQGIPRRIPRCV